MSPHCACAVTGYFPVMLNFPLLLGPVCTTTKPLSANRLTPVCTVTNRYPWAQAACIYRHSCSALYQLLPPPSLPHAMSCNGCCPLNLGMAVQVPEWGDVNVGNCEDLMAVISDYHKGEGSNKQDLNLVLLRVAFVVYVNSKLLPWMHYGHDLNMSPVLLTRPAPPPTASEACGVIRRVYHRSSESTSLDAFLAEAGPANPKIGSADANDEPAADAIVNGQKWQDLSAEEQNSHLDQFEGADKICSMLCR